MGLYICILTHLWQRTYLLLLMGYKSSPPVRQASLPAGCLPANQAAEPPSLPANRRKTNQANKQSNKPAKNTSTNQTTTTTKGPSTNQQSNIQKIKKLTSQTKDHVNTQAKSHRINVHNPFEWVGGSAPHINIIRRSPQASPTKN